MRLGRIGGGTRIGSTHEVVAQDDADIGCAAIELLIARGSDPTHPVRTVTLRVMLIPRGRRRAAAVPEL